MRIAQAAAAAALLAGTAVHAGISGNATFIGEYMFRGIALSAGPALQGGVDYVHVGTGLYASFWMSNTDFPGPTGAPATYETDWIGGWRWEPEPFALDASVLYYDYRDDTELNTVEFSVAGSWGPVTLAGFYTPEYYGTGGDGTYFSAEVVLPLADDAALELIASAGYTAGDGPQLSVGDDYLDYGLTLRRSWERGFSFALMLLGTNLDNPVVAGDNPRFLASAGYEFDL